MYRVRRLAGAAQPVQQQHLVEGVDQRMHAFAEHGRAAGDAGGDELGNRNGVARERGIDDKAGTGGSGHVSSGARWTADLRGLPVPIACTSRSTPLGLR